MLESQPILSDEEPGFIARPALQYWTTIGDGPIRALHQQPGAFDDDAFAVSYDKLYRLSRIDASINAVIYSSVGGAAANSVVNFCTTGDIGTIQPYLFWADGAGLFAYTENGHATNQLSYSGNVSDGDVVQIDGVYYQYVTGSVDAGTPMGTVGDPWLVAVGAGTSTSIENLFKAITDAGVDGTTYSTALTAHTTVTTSQWTSTDLYIKAIASGVEGNSLSCTETGSTTSWAASSTSGGGSAGVVQVPLPADYGAIDCAYINGYVIVIPAQSAGVNGRFYWIEPGEISIDPLNFATAERSADAVNGVRVFNDQFWLPGQNTNEVWYITGDANAPVLRLQGVVFDRGIHQGTIVQVKDSVCLIDAFGGVFQIQGGEKRISTPDIEERIRKHIAYQNARVL